MQGQNKGISMIELLIVVALIGILASVVGPQLAVFAVQGYDASAAADLRSAALAEKAFFANWGVYASSAVAGVPGPGGRILTNINLQASPPTNATGPICAGCINGTAPSSAIPIPGFQIGISQNVAIEINTSWPGSSYTMVSKNASGDRCFGMDSDTKAVYWVNGTGPVMTGAAPMATAGVSDFMSNGLEIMPGSANCTGYPAAGMGQLNWTIL